MVDHPLTTQDVWSYIETQGLEKFVNQGINKVLWDRPADGLSTLAAFLIDNANKISVFIWFEPKLKLLNEINNTLVLKTLIEYGGKIYTWNHFFTWN